jgi:O-antigen/teichoic acid export membrane protein
MSNIRVTYSGFLFFIVGMIQIFTGLGFLLIITRTLSPQEFGTWNLILGLLLYVSLIQPITSYWLLREVARDGVSGKTGIISSSMFSLAGICIFLVIAFFTSEQTDADREVLFFATLLIPILFINDALMAINMGFKPHIVSLGKLLLEILKIPLVITFVYFLDFGVQGVILAVVLANIPTAILLAYYGREKIQNPIKFRFLIKWIKFSWISLYPGLNFLFRSIDVLIFSLITGSVIGLAYYGAAWSVSSLVAQSGTISSAVYPKLLSNEKTDYLQDNITKIFYFAILLSAISITFASPGLFALNPLYQIALPLVLIMTMRFILDTFNRTFENFLIGVEKVDQNSQSSFKKYAQSKLFVIPTFRLIQNIIYMSLLATILLFYSSHNLVDLLTYWAILGFLTSIPITIYLSILVYRKFNLKFDYNVIKYIITVIVIFIPLSILTETYLEYNERILHFLPNLLLFVGLGITLYLSITYLVDNKTRVLFNAIIQEIKKK